MTFDGRDPSSPSRCYCGAALTDVIAKDGGTRVCVRDHYVVPCVEGSTCGGNVHVPSMGVPRCRIFKRNAVEDLLYTCDLCKNANKNAGNSLARHDIRTETAIDVAFEQGQKCALCGLRGHEHGNMLHPHQAVMIR